MPVFDQSQVRSACRESGAWGVFTGILVGVVAMGIIYDHRVLPKERERIQQLLSCDPGTSEQSILVRDAAGRLSCTRLPLAPNIPQPSKDRA